MAASVNKVIIVGNLGREPEIRTFSGGGKITTVRIATTERWRDKTTGENREITEWHTVVFNDRLAEIAGQYLHKGSQVYVEGSLRTRKWSDQNGQERYSTDIRAQSMQLLGSRAGASPQGNAYGGGEYDSGEYGGGDGAYQAAPRHAAHAPAPRAAAPTSVPTPAPAATPASPLEPQQPLGTGFVDFDDDIPF